MEPYHEENNPQLVHNAVAYLANQLPIDVARRLRAEMNKDPQLWWVPHHLHGGMWVRNNLRLQGFGETTLGVHNLDDYYVPIWEKAIRLATDGSTMVCIMHYMNMYKWRNLWVCGYGCVL